MLELEELFDGSVENVLDDMLELEELFDDSVENVLDDMLELEELFDALRGRLVLINNTLVGKPPTLNFGDE